MAHKQFNHVFLALLLISALGAFVVPPRYSNLLRGRIDLLFAPVAYPLRQVAATLTGRFGRDGSPQVFDDASASAEARSEIQRLRATVASLTLQIDQLRRLNANRELAGDAQRYSVPVKVIGGDSAGRDSLLLQSSPADGIAVGMPVIHQNMLVGRVSSASPGSARVRLISDAGFRLTASFGRFQKSPDGRHELFVPLRCDSPLVEGHGDGALAILNLSLDQVRQAGLQKGDWVILNDLEWPHILDKFLVGQVAGIEPARAPLHAEITVRPSLNMRQLREVLVVTGRLQQERN